MAARTSFSNDSRIVKMPLPKSLLLKDYLLDDLSSCSSNGFRSYPRRQCCNTVRYLVEIDLNKHIKLPESQKQQQRKQFLKSKSKSKPRSVLHRASAAVVNAFKHFPFSGAGKPRKASFLPRNLSRKLSKHGFWKRTTDQGTKEFKRLKSFDESIKKEENILSPRRKVSTAVTTAAELNTSTSNSNSSSESDFTATSGTSTTSDSSKINAAKNDVAESEQKSPEKKNTANGKKVSVATETTTDDSAANRIAKKEWQNEEKEQFSPVSVMDFPYDDNNDDYDDEVTSPYQNKHVHVEGIKRKVISRVRRIDSLAELEPIKLEDRIALSESRTRDLVFDSPLQTQSEFAIEQNQTGKKAMALLQLMKATMSSHNLFESLATESVLLGFFTERIIEKNDSDHTMLQLAKDWMNEHTRNMILDWASQNNRQLYIQDMENKVKWLKYNEEVEKREIGLELEHEVFISLVDEILLDFYL